MDKKFLEDATIQCLVWGSILVMLLVVVYHLKKTNEHMGEFARDLTDLDNHYRHSVNLNTKTIDNMEFRNALNQQDLHYEDQSRENFQGRVAQNVDPKEDEYMNILY